MDTLYEAPLTPEQIAAMNASGGFASCEDPSTHLRYHLVQIEPFTIDDDYVREKLEEAYADMERNGVQPLDMAKIKAELARRLAAKKRSAG